MSVYESQLKPRIWPIATVVVSVIFLVAPLVYYGNEFVSHRCSFQNLNWFVRAGGLMVIVVIFAVAHELSGGPPEPSSYDASMKDSGHETIVVERSKLMLQSTRLQKTTYTWIAVIGTFLASFGDYVYNNCPP